MGQWVSEKLKSHQRLGYSDLTNMTDMTYLTD